VPKTDYGFSRASSLTTGEGLANNYHDILATQGVTLALVTNLAGASNTMLLSHKIMNPANYLSTSDGNDMGFIAGYGYTDDGANQSGNANCGYCQDTNPVDENHMGGPHSSGSPVLWADDSVRMYQYRYVPPNLIGTGTDATSYPDNYAWQLFWCYDRPDPITAP
jgi:hypothetical protein